jgi:chemotaxis response regulator CheB
MPGAAVEIKAAVQVLPITQIGAAIASYIRTNHAAAGRTP